MQNTIAIDKAKLFLFSVFAAILSYGFALTNYTLTVDSETPIYKWYSLQLGRWGTNLVRYHIFNGHIPYFTMLLGLLLLALTAVELTKIFKLNGIKAYLFCALFVSTPQMAYQLVFTMQADVVPLGFLASVVAVRLFTENYTTPFTKKFFINYIISALLIMFAIACYQGLGLIPVVVFVIYCFQRTFAPDFIVKEELKKVLFFGILMLAGGILYFASAKILCPPTENGYLSGYTSAEANNRVLGFIKILAKNFIGACYYGNRLFPIAVVLILTSIVIAIKSKKHTLLRILALLAMLILPYGFSFFITNGYHPPRIYLTSGIVFAFMVVFFIPEFKFQKTYIQFCALICLAHIYFITSLFYAANSIYHYDKEEAKKMNTMILEKYPNFDPINDYVFFYGSFSDEHHSKFALKKSEIFAGSLFSWDNGNNWRINNFFKAADIANYRFLDDKPTYDRVKDSISSMPIWPNRESVKKINNVVIIKLGTTKGAPVPFEQ